MVAEHAGPCFGVRNAIRIAFDCAGERTYISGELVHNPHVTRELEHAGVVKIDDLKALSPGDRLIIRAHGEPESVYEYCREHGVKIIDAACPFVKKAQSLAEQMEKDGYQVVLVGDKNHPEVKSILARTKSGVAILSCDEINDALLCKGRFGILSQTTQKKENFLSVSAALLAHAREAKIYNTICSATMQRQEAAVRLAKQVDAMIVVGGKNSANTRQLYDLCNEIVTTYWVNDLSELDKLWLQGKTRIGLTAGASTPDRIIQQFREHLEQI